MTDFSELKPGSPLRLPEAGQVHLWQFHLSAPVDALARFRGYLDPEERARAGRFFREVHRNRFAAGRGMLRALLGRYVDCPPAELAFEYNPEGKPRLDAACNAPGLTFNLSHSGDTGLCAVARGITLGVDIEECRENRDILPIARRFFAPEEVRQLMALPESQQQAGFYQCWTSKEALIKAWGRGLSTPLDQFTVRVRPGEAELLSLALPEYSAGAWQLHAVPAPPGMTATLATEGPLQAVLYSRQVP